MSGQYGKGQLRNHISVFYIFFSGVSGKHSCEITKKTLSKLWSSLETDVSNLAISEIFYTFFDHLITFKFSGKLF